MPAMTSAAPIMMANTAAPATRCSGDSMLAAVSTAETIIAVPASGPTMRCREGPNSA